jgi:hypothetical protein
VQITLGLDTHTHRKKRYQGDAAMSKPLKLKQKYIPKAWQRVSSFATT